MIGEHIAYSNHYIGLASTIQPVTATPVVNIDESVDNAKAKLEELMQAVAHSVNIRRRQSNPAIAITAADVLQISGAADTACSAVKQCLESLRAQDKVPSIDWLIDCYLSNV